MAASHGSKAVFKIGTAADPSVVTDMSQYGNSVGAQFSRETGEVTVFAQQSKQYIPGLKDATIPFQGPYDDESDQILWDIYDQGVVIDFEYYPAGEGVGNVKYSGQMMITSYEVTSAVSDPNSASGQFQVSGDVAREVL